MYLWPEGVSRNLWPYALKYVCDIRNKFRCYQDSTPENLFSGVDSFASSHIQQLHPFGCPVYVLDDHLQGSLGTQIARGRLFRTFSASRSKCSSGS
jgi:hypothetical protein